MPSNGRAWMRLLAAKARRWAREDGDGDYTDGKEKQSNHCPLPLGVRSNGREQGSREGCQGGGRGRMASLPRGGVKVVKY